MFSKEIEASKQHLESLCQNQNDCKKKMKYQILEKNLNLLKNEIDYEKIFNKPFKYEDKNEKAPVVKVENSINKKYFQILNNAIYVRAFSDGSTKIINLTPYPIEVFSIKLKKKECSENNIKNDCYEFLNKNIKLSVTDLEFFRHNLNKNLDNYEEITFFSRFRNLELTPSVFEIEDVNYKRIIEFNDKQLG